MRIDKYEFLVKCLHTNHKIYRKLNTTYKIKYGLKKKSKSLHNNVVRASFTENSNTFVWTIQFILKVNNRRSRYPGCWEIVWGKLNHPKTGRSTIVFTMSRNCWEQREGGCKLDSSVTQLRWKFYIGLRLMKSEWENGESRFE